MTFVVLFILIVLSLILFWWLLASVFKFIGRIINDDVKKFKKEWKDE